MTYGPNASREYLKSAVMTASQEQLHLMLLDGAVRFTTRGLDAIREKNVEETFNALERAQRIVLELSNGLQREANPQLADRMAALYGFIYRRLIDANMQRDAQAAEEALRILRHQRETWAMVIEKISRHHAPHTSAGPPTADAPAGEEHEPRFVAEG